MEYVLTHGSITAVANSTGAELISLKDATGKEYIWQGDSKYWGGRNPNLFPIVGGLMNGEVSINGKTFHMNRHGFARNSQFSVSEQSENHIVFQLQESESTLHLFPFRFDLKITHKLTDSGFITRFEVANPGDTPLPFCIGAHTAFCCPMNEGEQFNDYIIRFDHPEDEWPLYPTATGCLDRENKLNCLENSDTIPLDHDVFAKVDTLIFDRPHSTGVSLLGPDGHGVHMEFSGFPMIAFWTAGAKQAPFVCLEPWHGCASFVSESGEFTDKAYCMTLQPGERTSLQYSVDLI
jgi:galactose mutarotase-like enzyme